MATRKGALLVLGLVLVSTIRLAIGSESPNVNMDMDTESGMDQLSKAAAAAKEKAESMKGPAGEVVQDAKDQATSFATWANERLGDLDSKMKEFKEEAN